MSPFFIHSPNFTHFMAASATPAGSQEHSRSPSSTLSDLIPSLVSVTDSEDDIIEVDNPSTLFPRTIVVPHPCLRSSSRLPSLISNTPSSSSTSPTPSDSGSDFSLPALDDIIDFRPLDPALPHLLHFTSLISPSISVSITINNGRVFVNTFAIGQVSSSLYRRCSNLQMQQGWTRCPDTSFRSFLFFFVECARRLVGGSLSPIHTNTGLDHYFDGFFVKDNHAEEDGQV